MSIEQKIGQLFVAVGYGARADQEHASNTSTTGVDTIAEIVRTHHVGGLIYFVWSENLEDIEQIATLCNDAQDAALESSGIPLIISADEERGVVSTGCRSPPPPLPGQMALGATGSRAPCPQGRRHHRHRDPRRRDSHQAFSPVADVNVEGAEPRDRCALPGRRSPRRGPAGRPRRSRGLQGANCSASAKHFPPATATPPWTPTWACRSSTTPARSSTELDLPPFRAAIEEGIDSIMTATHRGSRAR